MRTLSFENCAQRELKEETGINIEIKKENFFKDILNCHVFKINVSNEDIVDYEKMELNDSSGIGWVDLNCVSDFQVTFLTRKLLEEK